MKSKHKIDDIVYVIIQISRRVNKRCKYCDEGEITCKNNKTITCPKCYGFGSIKFNKLINKILKARIIKIRTTIEKHSKSIEYEVLLGNGCEKYVQKENIFKTENEAQIEQDKRNKK